MMNIEEELILLLESYENNSSLTDSYTLELFIQLANRVRDLKNEISDSGI